MALATRCPYCRTTFRVTHDQLKLRGGLVRCGACKEIFSGVENLLPAQPAAAPASAGQPTIAPTTAPDVAPASVFDSTADTAPAPHAPAVDGAAEPAEEAPAPPPAEPAQEIHGEAHVEESWRDTEAGIPPSAPLVADTAQHAEAPAPEPAPLPATTPEQDIDPLTRMTLMDMRPWPQAETRPAAHDGARPAEPFTDADEIERALGELQQKPWRSSEADHEADEIDALDNEEPDFVRQARLQAERRRKQRLVFGLGSALLAVLAILQAAIVMRTEIAARWPASVPVLSSLCDIAGCKIGLPQQIEYVTIESHELQALPNSDNAFVLSTLLRNRSRTVQAWPYLELTLNDAAEQPVARRVLAPADYLSPQERARGMQASSEKPVRVSFALSQLKASGYRLYVFYP